MRDACQLSGHSPSALTIDVWIKENYFCGPEIFLFISCHFSSQGQVQDTPCKKFHILRRSGNLSSFFYADDREVIIC